MDKFYQRKEMYRNNLILKEDQLFWIPTYNSVLLDQWLLLCERHTESRNLTQTSNVESKCVTDKPEVFICTTMYRETKKEMKQLLKSFKALLLKKDKEYDCHIHIFFDGAFGKEGERFVDQLKSLLKDLFDQGSDL
ncbi:uncharacterized protein LOC128238039 [Mya arenaria]|uniref:uncharacterized protein LOC128238039 n=1 Tax=Mya arenaria TaxID=6604 RepID=UPI0022E5CF6B|nr:uncharacterized protein LOC128238039 [Mya arenaria]